MGSAPLHHSISPMPSHHLPPSCSPLSDPLASSCPLSGHSVSEADNTRVGRGRSLPLWEALDLNLFGARDREPERACEPCIKSKTSDVQGTNGSMLSEV